MTVLEKNMNKLNKIFGLDKRLKDEGIKEGIKEGEHNKAIKTAKKMYQLGINITQISEATDLSLDELKKILK